MTDADLLDQILRYALGARGPKQQSVLAAYKDEALRRMGSR